MVKFFVRQILGIFLIFLGVVFLFLPFSPGLALIFVGSALIFGKEISEKLKRIFKIK